MSAKIGKALVVGAGIGGIRTALDLAETGYQVILIDCAAHIGGILAQLDAQFPTNRCGMCKMLPLVQRDAGGQFCLRKGLFHENIRILTATRLTGISGDAGDFQVRLRREATGVAPELCVGCGLCETVCPREVPDSFNCGLTKRKAIHLPVPHAIPNPYVIDLSACTQCGACAAICPTRAVRLPDQGKEDFRILVVDDEQVVRDSLREWLVNEGYTAVDMAESGAEALALLGRTAYQLMLTDIKMPGMDGVDLLHLAKETYPDLTVVMMTAYATVETAVEAMKTGALDYFMKPFDPEAMLPLVARICQARQAVPDLEENVQAVIFATGTAFFDPCRGINPYAYGRNPHVVTSLEFERLLSPSGPTRGRLTRPFDGKPIRKVAWMQCVGSRDLQAEADFCSSICCMFAVKEALLVKEKSKGAVDTAIFFMDLRAYGKGFQRYVDEAAQARGVRLERARVHSITPDPESGDPVIRAASLSGTVCRETFDMVVLAVGQRPAKGMAELARLADLSLNPWGFPLARPFAPARTSRSGVFLSGAGSGQKTIHEAMIQASAAAMEAGCCIHNAGGSPRPEHQPEPVPEALLTQPPSVLAVLCGCGGRLGAKLSRDELAGRLARDPVVAHVAFAERLCTQKGWDTMRGLVESHAPNRLLIGACHPYLFIGKLKQLSRDTGLPAHLMEVVDLGLSSPAQARDEDLFAPLAMTLQRLRHAEPDPMPAAGVTQQALVVGGGIAGLQAALSIAAMGYPVDLAEKSAALGGNLKWLHQSLGENAVAQLLAETLSAVQQQPLIRIHLGTRLAGAFGSAGNFHTTLAAENGETRVAVHGAIILATGGGEAIRKVHGLGAHPFILTQKDFETRIRDNRLETERLRTVVMIQCAGSREPPRNYCSRVCCATSLKHALYLKKTAPRINVYVLYRDLMVPGFEETYYTRARAQGVIFIQYEPDRKPVVEPIDQERLWVKTRDPVLGADVAIETELLVLAMGINPEPEPALASSLGIQYDADGFFQEAESKWRPLDSLKEGIFACGLALAPMTIDQAVASGQAAAQRALRILTRTALPAGPLTSSVRHSLCSLCQCCVETCPYAARFLDEEAGEVRVAPGMCQGCGACAAACPNGAAVLMGCSKAQVLAMIDGAFDPFAR